ncbi:hypothetical protein [Pedobacter sp. MC2016-24]|uniref:hypothetical protein n=1 Tax=Pedobacter sp. MC2016-24 TaxID=2780090 RepID=UPI00187DE931|nr:hypothetical protein [Pedobacter sp. MC2016-24]MBE9599597.1 hypothetical protein [Pedobacter sp. MC2016-24]
MRTFFKLFSFVLALGFVFNSCKNPADNLNILVDADIIKYKATFILSTSDGTAIPNDITVTATGTDAGSIYDFSGSKKIYAPAGVATIGVAPSGVPKGSTKLNFNVVIKATGFLDKNLPVSIEQDQFSQIIKVTLLRATTPSPASSVVVAEVGLGTDGKTTTSTTISTPVTGTVTETTSITVPAGVQFKGADGTILSGGNLSAQAVNFDPTDPAALALFPGGKLSAPNITTPGGTTGSAVFLPAGFTDIQMFVGGVEVKNFTTPINIGVQLDPTYKPQSSGQLLKAGDKLAVYSYQVSTGQFKYEGLANVALDASNKLAASFTTDHLTVFIVGDVVSTASCTEPNVTFIAPWLTGGATRTVNVEISNNDGKVLATSEVLLKDGLADKFRGLPPIPVRYRIIDVTTSTVLASGSIADPCAGGNLSITVGQPGGPAIQNVTLVLNVVCPNKGPVTPPNFDMFYKTAGAAESAYVLLGTANQGLIKTSLLKVGSTYDFRVTWKNETKRVNNRTITDLDMSTTVGEGLNLGTNTASNRALLIEACKSLN